MCCLQRLHYTIDKLQDAFLLINDFLTSPTNGWTCPTFLCEFAATKVIQSPISWHKIMHYLTLNLGPEIISWMADMSFTKYKSPSFPPEPIAVIPVPCRMKRKEKWVGLFKQWNPIVVIPRIWPYMSNSSHNIPRLHLYQIDQNARLSYI